MAKFHHPEALLRELGITSPSEIDLEAIAQYCGATILYAPLQGCEAFIAGKGNRAIITVNSSALRARQRFSGAHELGHWMRDRGRLAMACSDRQLQTGVGEDDPERRANRYAADLLMPKFLFRPQTRGNPVTFAAVRELARAFQTSLTATAIRMVEEGDRPAMLVFTTDQGQRRLYARSEIVPGRLRLRAAPTKGTMAAAASRSSPSRSGDVDLEQWIDDPRARAHIIHEDALWTTGGVLSLLWWKNEQSLIELDEESEEQESDSWERWSR
jgi:Zn-dependent peptidase ImmA (M78 family)